MPDVLKNTRRILNTFCCLSDLNLSSNCDGHRHSDMDMERRSVPAIYPTKSFYDETGVSYTGLFKNPKRKSLWGTNLAKRLIHSDQSNVQERWSVDVFRLAC
ncbi:hypothetical protein AVEN_92270-1 [Araneus ventricosus]|uniref:Uncharacterized protein n=1 Tax=Araneus ventricosus TaxID=182803 RepID=A0A4Y2AKX0_ARAVE|nr:hypothetical protein AVEN_92270-1 [Araneus ventricosus]